MPLAKFDVYLRAAIRKVWRWTSLKRRELKKKGECQKCGKKGLKGRALPIDHIDPVVDPQAGFKTWDDYIKRMMSENLQALCRPCHAAKSAAEAKERAKSRKERKTK